MNNFVIKHFFLDILILRFRIINYQIIIIFKSRIFKKKIEKAHSVIGFLCLQYNVNVSRVFEWSKQKYAEWKQNKYNIFRFSAF